MGKGNHFSVHTGGFLNLDKTELNGKMLTAYLYERIGWIIEWLIHLYNKFKRIKLFGVCSIIFLYLNY